MWYSLQLLLAFGTIDLTKRLNHTETYVQTCVCVFTGNENAALVSPGMTELYFDREDTEPQRCVANTILQLVQTSVADVLILCCCVFLSVDSNTLWFHTGMVWFHTGTPDKA